MAVLMSGCYTEVVDNLSTFSIQVPILFDTPFENRSVPDTSIDFTNLHKYPEYTEYKDRVQKAEILQLNYRIDSLIYGDGSVFNNLDDDLEFEYIRYSFQFANPLSFPTSPNKGDFVPDPNSPKILLGEFKNVKIKDYFRTAKHIIEVPEASAKAISDGLKSKPYFYVYTEYSRIKGQTEDEFPFDLIKAKFDVILRLEIKL